MAAMRRVFMTMPSMPPLPASFIAAAFEDALEVAAANDLTPGHTDYSSVAVQQISVVRVQRYQKVWAGIMHIAAYRYMRENGRALRM